MDCRNAVNRKRQSTVLVVNVVVYLHTTGDSVKSNYLFTLYVFPSLSKCTQNLRVKLYLSDYGFLLRFIWALY